jgi:hypothetical protein
MLASGSLTDSPTSLFWLTVGILILTVVLAAISVVTWRSAIARRKIVLTIASRSQILSAPQSMRDNLQIKYKDESIQGDPYVTVIELASAGRLSIRSDDFDANRSLEFALDTQIIKHLSTEYSPHSAPNPEITVADNTFSLAPELIAKGEVIKIALLTQGRPVRVETAFSPLSDVSIEIGDREEQTSKRYRQSRILSVVLLGAFALALGMTAIALVAAWDKSDTLSNSLTSTECGTITKDWFNTNKTLTIVQTQVSKLEGTHSGQGAALESFDQLLRIADLELASLYDDYYIINARVSNSTKAIDSALSSTINADRVIDQMERSEEVSTLPSLADQLPPIQKILSSLSCVT